jgi:UDP:flavonoid glycosyltransferase YjiC (YdhE family)
MGPEGITSQVLNLVPISPHVIAPDPRWEPRHRMTGYWFAEPPSAWQPPAPLEAFLDGGDPPVVISLGAMALAGDDTREAARLTLEALEHVGARAIVQGWDAALAELDLPPTVLRAGPIPHTWLLPQTRAIVHHGGFGTTATAFRAGIPAVVIPHIIDQFIWGQRVFELAVGPKPIPRAKLTAEKLAAALEVVLTDPAMAQQAAELGTRIRAEDGLATAVRLIEAAHLNT